MENLVQNAEFLISATSPSTVEAASDEEVIAKEVTSRYFETLSAEDFQDTASLFAEDGTLYPPFDSAVTGREAIVQYLETEAKGLLISPLKHTTELLEDGTIECRVTGKVQTSLFTVNAGWVFILNDAAEIRSVRIKLLAALEELLRMKPGTAES